MRRRRRPLPWRWPTKITREINRTLRQFPTLRAAMIRRNPVYDRNYDRRMMQ